MGVGVYCFEPRFFENLAYTPPSETVPFVGFGDCIVS